MRAVEVVALAGLAACGRAGFDLQPLTAGPDAKDVDSNAGTSGWTAVVAGGQTTCGIVANRAYCWGQGSTGAVGDGMGIDRAGPTEVALAGNVSAIAQGESHGCAIAEGLVYCWGNAPPGDGSPSSPVPTKVSGLPSPATSIACGAKFSCAVAAGAIYCWGEDTGAALGNGATSTIQFTPVLLSLPTAAISIDAGHDHAIALLDDGTVWAWGHNDGGALGTGSMSPTNAETPAATIVSGQPRIGGWHACTVNAGAATCWGRGGSGELGDGNSVDSAAPRTPVGMNTGVLTLDTGGGPADGDATCAVQSGGVWCWGNGDNGRLGDGGTTVVTTPTPVSALPSGAIELALGYNHSCARFGDGTLQCWGRGDLGQLGNGAATTSFVPVSVPLPVP